MTDKTIDEDESAEDTYGKDVGERLRQIRRQKRLSLQEVESLSNQEFRASVLGAYERGERSISVPRLARLANLYRVPVDQLLPELGIERSAASGKRLSQRPGRTRIDLTQLETLSDAESQMLTRYVRMIQIQRQDFNGRVLTIRDDDLRAIACILGVTEDLAGGRLEELGLSLGPTSAEAHPGDSTITLP